MKYKYVISIIVLVVAVIIGVCYAGKSDVVMVDTPIVDTREEETADNREKTADNTVANWDESQIKIEEADSSLVNESVEEPKTIIVHVCGEVNNPGVYELNEGDRIYQAVENAGGFTVDASQDYINLAETLNDGDKIYVPSKDEAIAEEIVLGVSSDTHDVGDKGDRHDNGLININLALKDELMTLPGVGESKAQAIIDYRDSNGLFHSIEDIMKIPGIKNGLFEKIKDKICV